MSSCGGSDLGNQYEDIFYCCWQQQTQLRKDVTATEIQSIGFRQCSVETVFQDQKQTQSNVTWVFIVNEDYAFLPY